MKCVPNEGICLKKSRKDILRKEEDTDGMRFSFCSHSSKKEMLHQRINILFKERNVTSTYKCQKHVDSFAGTSLKSFTKCAVFLSPIVRKNTHFF